MMRCYRIVNGERVPFDPPRRPRPKLCAVCHKPATHAWETTTQAVVLPREGGRRPGQSVTLMYACEEH